MGSSVGGGDSDELPVRRVSIQNGFSLSKYEIAYTDYARFAESTGRSLPDSGGYDLENLPVINTSWQDATAYVGWLSELTGKTYRLPTKAEWEFAAKSGSETNYPWGNDLQMDKANCRSCKTDSSESGPKQSGSYETNLGGLHDMNGNVWEWVQDCAHDGYIGAPIDGSAWDSADYQLRASYRNWRLAGDRAPTIGFRLV